MIFKIKNPLYVSPLRFRTPKPAQASKSKKVKIAALIHSFFLVPQETLKSGIFHSIKK
jgi:hypothetical protein